MKCVVNVVLMILCATSVACTPGDLIRVSPDTDQSLPLNSLSNVTFVCNVTGDGVVRTAVWEVEGRQVQLGTNPTRTVFEMIGIFIEEVDVGLIVLIVNRNARMQFVETGVMIRCGAFTATEPLQYGPFLFVRVYGRPEVPGDLRLVASKPTYLVWSRPSNIPTDVQINYTVTINSTTSELGGAFTVTDDLQFSVQFLEDALSDAEECEGFMFYVSASVADVEDSVTAVVMDTVPLSTNVSFIDSSLKVDSVLLQGGGSDVIATVSFEAVESCSDNFPIRNYTLLVGNTLGPTILATPTDSVVTSTLTSEDVSILVPDEMFQIGVRVCSDFTCRNSTLTVPLNTSDVQTASVIFYENNVFLSCEFADGSTARGCEFTFQVNQNGTESDQFVVLQSEGQQCNVTTNQRNGYTDISVLDLESDGMSRGQLSIVLDAMVLESEAEYTEMTGCSVPRGVNQVVNIVVPIVVVLLLLAVLTIIAVVLVVYYRSQKLAKEPEFAESEFPDTLSVTIKSDHQKLLEKSPLTRRSTVPVMRSLPLSSHPMTLNPQRSLPRFQTDHAATISFSVPPERAAPIEVELHRDSVKLKLNKSALRAVARFHYMAKRHAQSNEGVAPESLSSEESQSLLAMSNISRVHITDEFKSMCCELPPVEEGGEEEEELKSWGIISTPPLSPPHKDELSAV